VNAISGFMLFGMEKRFERVGIAYRPATSYEIESVGSERVGAEALALGKTGS
jgi:hypothetical protein